MRSWKLAAVAAVMILGLGVGNVRASYRDTVDLVDSWYARYLGRPADPTGLRNYVTDLRSGIDPILVESTILGSSEYYHRRGCTPEGFVIGLFRDVLGTVPCSHDLRLWCDRLRHCGRDRLALRFLQENRLVARPVIVDPVHVHRPVIVDPVVVHRPVIVDPIPVRPYRGPVYDPSPSIHFRTRGLSIHIR